MADYYALVANAVAGLDRNTGEARGALYERERVRLVADLRNRKPPISESEISRERSALEDAIRKVEAEALRRLADPSGKLKVPEFPRWEKPASWPPASEGSVSRSGPKSPRLKNSTKVIDKSAGRPRRAAKNGELEREMASSRPGPADGLKPQSTNKPASAQRAGGKILISYRRSDSRAIAGRIFDRLKDKFGRGKVIMDVDTFRLGIDFRDQIRAAVLKSNVVIAVIGEKWIGRKKGANLRIHEPDDYVRFEIEMVLEMGIHLIPVLVEGAEMPKPDKLPSSLRSLAYKNAASVDSGRDFHSQLNRLIKQIEAGLRSK